MPRLHNAGIYTRLSINDADNTQKKGRAVLEDESGSIENQKLLLTQFAMLNGWLVTKIYVDDGYGGGNFQRPGFQEMLADAKKGVIDLILVKDLSRLGRDYIEVGRYTNVVFPAMGCRFISLLDEIDTSKEDNDMMHFRSLMNDYQLKDLSNKIKAVFSAKSQRGAFMTGRPPYGYVRSEGNKHRLLPEPFAAGIIQRIFALRAEGAGYTKIAGILNSEGIYAPSDYWHIHAGKLITSPRAWLTKTVKDILRCEAYIGNIVIHTEGTLSYKDRRTVKRPQSEWIRHESVHEPIIDRAAWDRVREIDHAAVEGHLGRKAPEDTLFCRKLICAGCGGPMVAHPMSRRGKDGVRRRTGTSYHCYRHSMSGYTACSWHSISENALKILILKELQVYATALTLDEAAILNQLKKKMSAGGADDQALLSGEVRRLQKRLADLERIAADLYEDKVARKLSETAFASLIKKNEQERQARQGQLDETQARLSAVEEALLNINQWAEVIRRHVALTNLRRADVEELIEHVEIGESDYTNRHRCQDVKIFWRFVGAVDES
jgi:DNA invertase Pin-like site-specific DNA recombinase